jgi:hypothetical protein
MARQTSKWLKQMTVELMLTPSLRKRKNFPFNSVKLSIELVQVADKFRAVLKQSFTTFYSLEHIFELVSNVIHFL